MGDIFIKDLPLSRTFDESDSFIKEDVNGTKQAYFNDLRDHILPTTEREQIQTNQEDISRLKGMVGSPLVAKTASEMTDTSHIYVYVGSEEGFTNGNWYYYNGESWVSGGVYNSSAVDTDTTLSISGKAADAKATGDAIKEVDVVEISDETPTNPHTSMWIQPNQKESFNIPEIKDDEVSPTDTWSSEKIFSEFNNMRNQLLMIQGLSKS